MPGWKIKLKYITGSVPAREGGTPVKWHNRTDCITAVYVKIGPPQRKVLRLFLQKSQRQDNGTCNVRTRHGAGHSHVRKLGLALGTKPPYITGFDPWMAYKMAPWIALVVLLSAAAGSAGMSARDDELIKARPAVSIFFREEDLSVGDQFAVAFVPKDRLRPFPPRRVADSIPFSLAGLPTALKMLGIPEGSRLAKSMATSLRMCEDPPTKGEIKFCANSLESFADRVRSILGPRVRALQSMLLSEKGSVHGKLQNYTVTDVYYQSKSPSSSISCHPMEYAHAAFVCHKTYRTRLYKALLQGQDGTVVDAVSVCHEDTSDWERGHVSFKVLGLKAGEAPVCHVTPEGHIVWVSDD